MCSRRRILACLAILAAGGLAGWPAAPAPGAAPEWTVPQRPVTVTYWDTADAARNELMANTVIPAYMRLHNAMTKSFTVKYVVVPDLPSKILAAIEAGAAPDLFSVPDGYLPNLYDAHVMDPLPPSAWDQHSHIAVMGTYLPHALDAQVDGGRVYAVPAREHAPVLLINNRMFRAAGLDPVKNAPKTWIDVAKLNTLMTKQQGGQVVQKGFEMRYDGDGRWQAQLFQILLNQAGGAATRAGLPAFNNDAGVRALAVWRSVTVNPRVTHNTAASPYQDFAAEQDVMTVADPNAGPFIEAINPAMAGNYTAAPLPQMTPDRPVSAAYSDNWAVNTRAPADQRVVAWDFVHFAATQPRLFWTAARHFQPVPWYNPLAGRQLPFLGVYVREVSIARPLARSTHYLELQSSLARMIDRVILNGADPKQALDQAADEYAAAYK